VILRLAVSAEHRLVTNGQTDRHKTTANTRVARVKKTKFLSPFVQLFYLYLLALFYTIPGEIQLGGSRLV